MSETLPKLGRKCSDFKSILLVFKKIRKFLKTFLTNFKKVLYFFKKRKEVREDEQEKF